MEMTPEAKAARSAKAKGTRAAGQRFELKCKKFLESIGFTVDKARQAAVFLGTGRGWAGSPNDFLGCADLLGVHPEKQYTLFVQCTLDPGVGRKKADLLEVKWNLLAQRVQIWMPAGNVRGGIRVIELRYPGSNVDLPKWSEALFRMVTGECPVGGIL